MKLAMVNVRRRLRAEGLEARLILQVHDELIAECPEHEAERVAALLEEEMERRRAALRAADSRSAQADIPGRRRIDMVTFEEAAAHAGRGRGRAAGGDIRQAQRRREPPARPAARTSTACWSWACTSWTRWAATWRYTTAPSAERYAAARARDAARASWCTRSSTS